MTNCQLLGAQGTWTVIPARQEVGQLATSYLAKNFEDKSENGRQPSEAAKESMATTVQNSR